jgi:hypothetical protein
VSNRSGASVEDWQGGRTTSIVARHERSGDGEGDPDRREPAIHRRLPKMPRIAAGPPVQSSRETDGPRNMQHLPPVALALFSATAQTDEKRVVLVT